MSDTLEHDVVFHDEVQLLDWGESRASGAYVKLRFRDAELLEPFRGMDTATKVKPGHILYVTICRSDPAVVAAAEPELPDEAPQYGTQARTLRLSSFFRTPGVWSAVGTDKQFLAWLRLQPCALKGCKGVPVEAAHVRRVANGAGMGVKPQYSAVPLCSHHHGWQHSQGEEAVGGREQMDKWRIDYLQQWCWGKLKYDLGYEHWNEVPPLALSDWANGAGVEKALPGCYR